MKQRWLQRMQEIAAKTETRKTYKYIGAYIRTYIQKHTYLYAWRWR